MTRTVQVRITGRVQGVGYRDWTQRQAISHGLAGWVRNRRDGSVEALFSGSDVAVSAMLEACKSGPAAARVESVTEVDWVDPVPSGFSVLPTS